MGRTVLETTIEYMDAGFKASPKDFVDNSEIVSESESLIDEFKKKYEITESIGNSGIWDSELYDKARKDYDELEVKLFLLSWEHMKTLMIDCGTGSIASELLDKELIARGITKKEMVEV